MLYSLSALIGFIVGSFANVCIYRLPREESVLFPASHCPGCGTRLRIRDNIPLLSFIWLKGRCHVCRAAISWRYPLVEITMAALFLLAAWRFSENPAQMVLLDVVSFYFLTISIIDYQHRIIPDELSLSLIALGVVVSLWNPYLPGGSLPNWAESVLAALAGGGLMLGMAWLGEKIFRKEALGGGDVKLMAAFGAILGWGGLSGGLILGSFLGALVGGALLLMKRKKPGDTIPYGPFLCLGAYFSALFPGWASIFLFP